MEKSAFTRAHKILCRLLRELRQEAGVTQIELAARLGETQSEVSKFERGERRLDLVQLQVWCEALGASLSDFVTRFEKALPRKK